MLNGADALEVFAAISIGVAGFSAIVVALVANTIVYDERRLNWGLGIVFCWSLGASFFSVLPFMLFYFGMSELIVWRSGLIVMGGYVAIASAVVTLVDRHLNQIGLDIRGILREAPIKISRVIVLANAINVITATTLVIAGAALPILGFYLVGMTVMLAHSLWTLMFIFFLGGLLYSRAGRSQQKSKRG